MPLKPARRRRRGALAALAVLLGLAAPLATARAACRVDVRPVAFGTVDLARRTTGTGRVVVTCDSAARFEVAISGPARGRRMRGPGGAALAYDLFQDSAKTVRWGEGSSARGAVSDPRTPARLTIHGLVPSQSGPPPGQYLDQLQVTLSF